MCVCVCARVPFLFVKRRRRLAATWQRVYVLYIYCVPSVGFFGNQKYKTLVPLVLLFAFCFFVCLYCPQLFHFIYQTKKKRWKKINHGLFYKSHPEGGDMYYHRVKRK